MNPLYAAMLDVLKDLAAELEKDVVKIVIRVMPSTRITDGFHLQYGKADAYRIAIDLKTPGEAHSFLEGMRAAFSLVDYPVTITEKSPL